MSGAKSRREALAATAAATAAAVISWSVSGFAVSVLLRAGLDRSPQASWRVAQSDFEVVPACLAEWREPWQAGVQLEAAHHCLSAGFPPELECSVRPLAYRCFSNVCF